MLQITWQLLQFVAFSLLAIAAYTWFRRGRRVGEGPHCAKCDYDLSDGERERCPECGALLGESGAVARGALERPTGRAVLAVACVVGAASAGGSVFWQYAFTHQAAGAKTVAKLLENLATADRPDDTAENPAMLEILRRQDESGWQTLLPDLDRHFSQRLNEPPEAGWLSMNENSLLLWALERGGLSPGVDAAMFEYFSVIGIRVPRLVRGGDVAEVSAEHHRRVVNGWIRFEIDPDHEGLRSVSEAVRHGSDFYIPLGQVRFDVGTHRATFQTIRKIATRWTETEPDESAYRIRQIDISYEIRAFPDDEFDAAMQKALDGFVELRAWAGYVERATDFLVTFVRPCPIDGVLWVEVKEGDRRRPLGCVQLLAGQELPISARIKDLTFPKGQSITAWARFVP